MMKWVFTNLKKRFFDLRYLERLREKKLLYIKKMISHYFEVFAFVKALVSRLSPIARGHIDVL